LFGFGSHNKESNCIPSVSVIVGVIVCMWVGVVACGSMCVVVLSECILCANKQFIDAKANAMPYS